MYHNTQALEDTREYQQKAMTQDDVILAHFQKCDYGSMFAPSDLQWLLPLAPITLSLIHI